MTLNRDQTGEDFVTAWNRHADELGEGSGLPQNEVRLKALERMAEMPAWREDPRLARALRESEKPSERGTI